MHRLDLLSINIIGFYHYCHFSACVLSSKHDRDVSCNSLGYYDAEEEEEEEQNARQILKVTIVEPSVY